MPAHDDKGLLVIDFKKIDKRDLPLVGGKGANLGEMTKAKFPVPGGFAVTVHAYDRFLDENNLHDFLKETLAKVDRQKPDELEDASKAIARKFSRSTIPKDVVEAVRGAYGDMAKGKKKPLVAARSSATAEDLPEASFAGQQATYLNVEGDANLLERVRDCWASLFTARAIFYREENKIKHAQVKISVIVQMMLQSDVSGVMFTVDPVTNDKDRIIIESVWGLGEMIVQGSVVPDRYVVQKGTMAILSKEISDQSIQLVKEGHVTKEGEVPEKLRDVQKITDEDIVALAKIGQKLQDHYYFPQDIEWVKDEGELYIVQTRPVTTLGQKTKGKKQKGGETGMKTAMVAILTGSAASPGMGTGHVKIVNSAKQLGKVHAGDVLVSKMTSPDFVPAMKKASAIVTDQGGMTSHAAIVSRELGIPAVVGTKDATSKLKEGTVVTVNGTDGEVFLGGKTNIVAPKKVKEKKFRKKTATNIYVNLAEPELAAKVAKENVDGVGLLRAEFMIANIGVHPKEAIKNKKQEMFIRRLTKDLTTFCKAFGKRPVIYRATDFKTNEYRSLPGGKHWEPEESNPMLGYRGAFRYVANPDVFNLELQAIKRVREKYSNLCLMIPFVRSPEELSRVRRMVAAEGLFKSASFKFLMMVELPVNVIRLREFIEVGIDGVSIGSNDLTMLLTGTDRDNGEVARAFNERDPAVYWALRRVIRICHKYGVTSSICGQAPSVYEDLVKKLVKYGITSISVNPDAINRVRRVVYNSEKEVANGKN